MKKEFKNVFMGPLGFNNRARKTDAVKITTAEKISKLLNIRKSYNIDIRIGSCVDEILFYKYNPRCAEEVYLGKRKMVA